MKVCFINWIINGITANHYQRERFQQQFGFSFSHEETNNMIYTVRLAIRMSTGVNNTELQCEVIFDGNTTHPPVNSSHAKLIVIAGEVNDQ